MKKWMSIRISQLTIINYISLLDMSYNKFGLHKNQILYVWTHTRLNHYFIFKKIYSDFICITKIMLHVIICLYK